MGAPAEHHLGHGATSKHLYQETEQAGRVRPSNSLTPEGRGESSNLHLLSSGGRGSPSWEESNPHPFYGNSTPQNKQTCPPTHNAQTLI